MCAPACSVVSDSATPHTVTRQVPLLHPAILSTCCVPDSVQVPSSSYFQRSEEKRARQPSPGVLGPPGAIRFSCIPHSGCLRHSWEQMLGPEVKRSWQMIDDSDLQPEVVRSGERTNGRPYGIPTPAAPYDNGGSLLPAHCLSTCSTWFTHSVAHRIFALRGLDREAPELGQTKAGESVDRRVQNRGVRLGRGW